MKVRPLASDSLGVRSMATLVETKDAKIAIDPDAALGPSRYGLPPHPDEMSALEHYKEAAHKAAQESDIIVISHYHYDHFDTGGEWFKGKTLYVKSIREDINKSQMQRGSDFGTAVARLGPQPAVEGRVTSLTRKNGATDVTLAYARGTKGTSDAKSGTRLIEADGKEFKKGKTKIKFSPAVPHGPPGIKLGYVLMTLIDDGYKFVHASDVQGPVADESTDWIIEQKPDLLYMDGPPILFLGWKFSYQNLEQSKVNFQRILDETKAEVILDHHLLRSLDYKEQFPFFDGKRVRTAAEYLGRENAMLEAHRKELWQR